MNENEKLDKILEELKNRKNAQGPSPEEVVEEKIAYKKADDLWNDFVSPTKPIVDPDNDPMVDPDPVDEIETQQSPLEADMVDFSIKSSSTDLNDFAEYEEQENISHKGKGKKSNKKTGIVIAIIIVLIIAIGVGIGLYFANHKKSDDGETKKQTTEVSTTVKESEIGPVNPLTGEAGYDESLLTQRPIAVVVENEYSTSSVRPQWGIADADIVLEGESEYSTRLLMFWANFNNVPDQVGPARSARPPFIRFSELFDAIFIHAGLSNTANGYIGADTVFEEDGVDHINLLHTSEDGKYFGRDYSRTSTVEHTGYLNGKNVATMIESYKINTSFEPASFTQLQFNEKITPLSSVNADSVSFKWNTPDQGGRCPKTAKFTYDADGQYYTTTDFDSSYGESNVKWTNLIFLLDTTTYVEKTNYKGSGQSEIYCDYSLSGGKGTVVSNGTAVDITWGVDNGKLCMKDAEGKDVLLNPGKSYIGYGSQNKGGVVTLNSQNSLQE